MTKEMTFKIWENVKSELNFLEKDIEVARNRGENTEYYKKRIANCKKQLEELSAIIWN